MTRLGLIGLIITTYSVDVASAMEVCSIRGAKDNLSRCIFEHCSTPDRTRSIQFPDGREIWVIGHNHGNRSYPRKLNQVFSQKPLNERALNQLLDEILENNLIPIKHAEEDIRFLERFLETRSAPSFVGVETFNSNINPHISMLFDTQKKSFENMNSLNFETKLKLEKVLPSVYGPHLYKYIQDQRAFEMAYLKGFETEKDGDNEVLVDARRAQIFSNLKDRVQSNDKLYNDVVNARAALVFLNENYDPDVHDKLVLNSIRNDKEIPKYLRPQIETWVRAELATLNARLERDKTTAKGMGAEGRSGVLFVGQLHLNGIARMLQEECHKELNGHEASPMPAKNSPHGYNYESTATR